MALYGEKRQGDYRPERNREIRGRMGMSPANAYDIDKHERTQALSAWGYMWTGTILAAVLIGLAVGLCTLAILCPADVSLSYALEDDATFPAGSVSEVAEAKGWTVARDADFDYAFPPQDRAWNYSDLGRAWEIRQAFNTSMSWSVFVFCLCVLFVLMGGLTRITDALKQKIQMWEFGWRTSELPTRAAGYAETIANTHGEWRHVYQMLTFLSGVIGIFELKTYFNRLATEYGAEWVVKGEWVMDTPEWVSRMGKEFGPGELLFFIGKGETETYPGENPFHRAR